MTEIASARRTGRDPDLPYVPVIIRRFPTYDRSQIIRAFAFATRSEAVAFAEKAIAHHNEHATKAPRHLRGLA
jgi:hypothetical protein